MRCEDLRTIYFVPPKHLLEDVKRCFAKLGLQVNELEESGDRWTLTGSKPNASVTVSLLCEKKAVEPLNVFGEILVSCLRATVESGEDFISAFKTCYETCLLRCLG